MLIHRIFHRPPIKYRNARGRRFPYGLCLRLECLENRTPLSSGLIVGIEAVIASGAVEIGSVVPGSPVHFEMASIEANTIDQAISTASSEAGFMNLAPSASPSSTPPSLLALETFLSSAPVGASISAVSSMAGPDGIVARGQVGNLSQPAAVEVISQLPESELLSTSGNVLATAGDTIPMIDVTGDSDVDAISQLPHSALLSTSGNVFTRAGDPISMIEDGDGEFTLSQLRPGPFMGPGLGRFNFQTNNDDDDDQDTDMSFAGSLESIEMDDGFSPWTTTPQTTGRAIGHASNFFFTDPSLQLDVRNEGPSTTGLSYLASGGGGSTLYSPTSAGDDLQIWDDDSTEPISSAAITLSGVSLSLLLSDPDLTIKTAPGNLDQFAELVPLPESSLALAATLWTVPSDSPSSSVRWDASTGRPIDPEVQKAATSSWILFVTGIDQALEQTSRGIRDGMFSHNPHQAADEGPAGAPDELIDWQGPILPGSQGGLRESKPKLPRTSRVVTSDEAGLGTLRSRHDSRPHSDDGQPVALGVMPMISAVSITTMIAGWFWRKRQQSQSPGGGRSGSRGSLERPAAVHVSAIR
jgi:hypothetical protein